MFKLFKKKDKPVELLVVTPAQVTDINAGPILTIVATEEDCAEYINKRIYLENKEHFHQWCDLRNIDLKNPEVWKLYLRSGNVNLHQFIVTKAKYRRKDLAAVLRMFNQCVPVGTSYDTAIEVLAFGSSNHEPELPKVPEAEEKDTKKLN